MLSTKRCPRTFGCCTARCTSCASSAPAKQVLSPMGTWFFLAGSFRKGLICAVLKGMFPWRTRYPLSRCRYLHNSLLPRTPAPLHLRLSASAFLLYLHFYKNSSTSSSLLVARGCHPLASLCSSNGSWSFLVAPPDVQSVRPVHLLRVFLLRVLESNFPGDSLYNYMDMIVPTP